MLSLSPAKLLVILVVALIVLGPDKLPQMARQLGAFWHDIRQWRGRIESEVRGTFPNLPPTHEVARAVRSPLAFLDRLADEHERELDAQDAAREAADDDDDDEPSSSGGAEGTAEKPAAQGAGLGAKAGSVNGAVGGTSGVADGPVNRSANGSGGGARNGVVTGNGATAPGGVAGSGADRRTGPGGEPGAGPGSFAADDPSMN